MITFMIFSYTVHLSLYSNSIDTFFFFFFFFNDTATTEIYTLSLHDALPISGRGVSVFIDRETRLLVQGITGRDGSFHTRDRKSTRLNSSHGYISYAVFCLKKKKKKKQVQYL